MRDVSPGFFFLFFVKGLCWEFGKALAPGSEWQENAKKVAQSIEAKSGDGVPENVRQVAQLLEDAKPIAC